MSFAVQVRDGAFLCPSQRLDGEKELVTSDSHARLLFWDCDYAEATLVRHTKKTSIRSLCYEADL